MQERLVKAKPHDWIIPKKIILGLLIFGIVVFVIGIILTCIGSPSGLYSAGKALLGIGICFLSICLLLCLYAHLVWYVVDQETQTWDADVGKTSPGEVTKLNEGTPAIFDLNEMVDGGYPTKPHDNNKLTPQPSPKRVRISPTTQMIGDGPSGKERIVPTIITSSDETPKSMMKATAVAVTTEAKLTDNQQQQQLQQQLQQHQQQQLQQQQLQKQRLQQEQLKQQQLLEEQQKQQQEQLLKQQQQLHQKQMLEEQKKQQQEFQQKQLQEQQKQLELQQQQQQHLQQQLQQQQQQLQQQYQHHHYQPTQVVTVGRQPKPDQTPGYADYETVTGRDESEPQHSPPVVETVPLLGPTHSQLPPTGSPRVPTGATHKPILVETFTVNGGKGGGVPYTSTPASRSQTDASLAFQQQQQQQYQTLIREQQKQQQHLQQQQQQLLQQQQQLIQQQQVQQPVLQQVHQQVQQQPVQKSPPLIVEPQHSPTQLEISNSVIAHDQATSLSSSSDRSTTSTITSTGTTTQQTSQTEVEDDDYDDADNMPSIGTYPRRHWLQDLENPPEPTPLQYPSAKRPMTFRNNSSSKNSIYDNVTLPYLDS